MPLENTKEKTSDVLAAIIVAYRAIGFDKEAAKSAMQELAERKAAGDDFNYEEYISSKLATIQTKAYDDEGRKIFQFISNIGRFVK